MSRTDTVDSIIICTYNRCESLKDTLESFEHQECDSSFDYEVIVVDNNSNDKTREVVESHMPKFNGKLRYIFESIQGLSHARNAGIKESKGEIVAFTDDDVIVGKGWLNSIVKCFQENECDAMGGRVLPLYPDKTPAWIKKYSFVLNGPIPIHDYGTATVKYSEKMLPFIGANMAFRKSLFREIGLFSEKLGPGTNSVGEDTQFFRRLEKEKFKVFYCGRATAMHKVAKSRMNLRYLRSWFIASGRYLVRKSDKPETLICYFGIPRYLFKQYFINAIGLINNVFNQGRFLYFFSRFFTTYGQIKEYSLNKYAKS